MKIKTKTEALNIVETSYLASLSSLLWVALYYLPINIQINASFEFETLVADYIKKFD